MEEKQTIKTISISTYPEQPPIEHHRTPEQKKHKTKKLYLLLLFTIILASIGSGTTLLAYQKYNPIYHDDLSLAQTGMQHLRNAAALLATLPKKPLDATAVAQAQLEFSAASTAFNQVNSSLQSLPSLATFIPVYGNRLSTAMHLASLAAEASQAGIATCTILKMLISRFADPLHTTQNLTGLTMADIGVIAKNLHQIKTTFDGAVQQFNQLPSTDTSVSQLDPRLSKYLPIFRQNIPAIQAWINDAERLVAVAPALLGIGSPTNYLIELLDSTELRPAGGFIGNIGVATLSGGRPVDTHITDVYLFDYAFSAKNSIPYPAQYQWFSKYLASTSWSIRDSNLEADFPTSAQYAEINYMREGGTLPFQGVIAITPALIQQMLTITGPIYIPEYHETVTSQNLIDRIHYHQLGSGREGDDVPAADGHSSVRKHFTELLSEHFMARIHQLSAAAMPAILQLLLNSLHSKDLQIYLNSNAAEDILKNIHLASAVQTPVDDGLFIVDANISANKANALITNTLTDVVTIDQDGNAFHHTTLRYVWGTKGDVYGLYNYRDYVRAYMPLNSLLLRQGGWQPEGASIAYGQGVRAGFFIFHYHQTVTITLDWTVPHAAKKDAQGWHYQYQIQRQAGAQWVVKLEIHLPPCAEVGETLGNLAYSKVTQTMTLNQSLSQDMLVGMKYICR